MSSSPWHERPDGSRARLVNGIRLVDRSRQAPVAEAAIEHLVTWQENGGQMIVLGLDAGCRPVSIAAL
jgi:hypothetical protein